MVREHNNEGQAISSSSFDKDNAIPIMVTHNM
jgi:hypothetical protein